MDRVIGFIGCGNMAKAMIGGILKSGLVNPKNIIASARTKETLENSKKQYGIMITLNNKEVAIKSDYLVIAVKPYMYDDVLAEIKDVIRNDQVIISIAAGISVDYIKRIIGEDKSVVRAMPNTPAMVGEGMTALIFDNNIPNSKKNEIISMFTGFGKCEIIDESLIDAFTALCGSSPAYVYMMIEAMADAGVLEGIPRKQAYKMAAQSVLGAAKMVLETNLHPGELKDNVCSPKGTTIEAVAKLEECGFRSAIIKAVRACAEKSRKMSR